MVIFVLCKENQEVRMKMLVSAFFPLLFICSLSSAQSSEPVSRNTLIAFMDTVQAGDSMKVNNLSSANGLNDVLEDTTRVFRDTLFNADDKRFFRKQLAYYRSKEWVDSDKIAGARIIPQAIINSYAINGESGWKKFHSKYGDGYKVVSFPLFTTDMNCAVVAICYHIKRYSKGSLHLYKKVKGKWMDVKVYSTWMG
jgi:hypothetical protein